MSPYILFVKEKRTEIAKSPEAEGKGFAEIMRLLGDAWKRLPHEERRKYYAASEQDRVRHATEQETYEKESEVRKL